MKRVTGEYIQCTVGREMFTAFVPAPLPPKPSLEITPQLLTLMERANRELGRLDAVSDLLPDEHLFLVQYVRKEALLSSQIEGTQSSLSDLLLFELDEAPGVPLDDVEEVSNYVAALNHGLQRLQSGFPLSLRLLREIHQILLSGGRGATKLPGEFRRSQNWIGGTRPGNAAFVPPPVEKLQACLDQFERFLHEEESGLPILIRSALAHVQFETIHPFLDGNGRLGRLLITLMLVNTGALRQPMLYLSLHFKTHRGEYYDQLSQVRKTGDWESWLEFFFRGVAETANSAVETARSLLTLFEDDRRKLRGLGRLSGTCLQIHEYLQRHPITNIAQAEAATSINRTSVSKAISQLQALGMVREITGKRRYRLYAYAPYLDKLSEGTEPL